MCLRDKKESAATNADDGRVAPEGSRSSRRIASILPVLVAIDMLGVSLVVPLLPRYYEAAGISSARTREFLGSLFSSSQIVGGLAIGALSDCGLLSRRQTLLVSFLGSAASYALIMYGTVPALVFGRVLVGLVKQTMTVATGLLAQHTGKEERATQMGRLTASSTAAWIVGPSVGAFLYKHVGPSAPALAACALFVANSAIAGVFLPNDADAGTVTTPPPPPSEERPKSTTSDGEPSSFASNLKCCFTSSALASAVLAKLLFWWTLRATSYSQMASYYETLYGIETHQRGYLASYQGLCRFVAQSFLVGPLLAAAGGSERRAACLGAIGLAFAAMCESFALPFPVFVGFVCPLVSASTAVLGLSLGSLVTQVAPKRSLGSVLAALDVLQNAAAVTVPFYRAALFEVLGRVFAGTTDVDVNVGASMTQGDPDPYLWLKSSAVHWIVASVAFVALLLRGQRTGGTEKKKIL